MKEIELLIDKLKKILEEKKNELSTDATYAWGMIENRRKDIENFEKFYNARERNPAHRNKILSEFRKGAAQIAKDIESIKN